MNVLPRTVLCSICIPYYYVSACTVKNSQEEVYNKASNDVDVSIVC